VHYPPVQVYSHKAPLTDLTYASYQLPIPYISHSPDEDYSDGGEQKTEIGAEPSLRFARATWWDSLISLYSSKSQPHALPTSSDLRNAVSGEIYSDIRFLFRSSTYWFSFLNISRFLSRLHDPTRRHSIQPSLVLAALAIATFMQSSESERGAEGRAWSMRLRDEAQSALQASFNARWVDESLVHASWLIAFFEVCAHPAHSTNRVRSAMETLDSLIRSLALTTLDKDHHHVSTFHSNLVPIVQSSRHNEWEAPILGSEVQPQGCTCHSYTLGQNSPQAQEATPMWLMTPAWKDDWSDGEIRKEECRRIVWSSMMLAAGHSSYTAASPGFSQIDLFISDPANYAVLFPGECLLSSSMVPTSPKDTVWALFVRAMLLWHSCIRMRRNHHLFSDADKAQFAVDAWLEADRIEAAFSRHQCLVERAYMYQGREFLFNCRMCISYEFQRYIPQATVASGIGFYRSKAAEWLKHQANVAKQALNLRNVTGHPDSTISKRPFFVFWFMSQISRALTLWGYDQTLVVALELSKNLLAPIEYLMALWPCAEQQRRFHELRNEVAQACHIAGVPPP